MLPLLTFVFAKVLALLFIKNEEKRIIAGQEIRQAFLIKYSDYMYIM